MRRDNQPDGERQLDLRSTLTKRQILDGARQVFLQNGFVGTSIDQIVAHASVSKASIYRYFESKDALFGALITGEAERIAGALPSIDPEDPDPVSALRHIGIAILETLNNPTTLITLRLIIGALSRFPQLGEEFRRTSLGPTVEEIAAYLDVRATACGVRIDDSSAAAEEFTRRCLAHVSERILVPGLSFLTEAGCMAVVEDILRNYLIRRLDGVHHGESNGLMAPHDREA
jgi:AcrR family transcriptional regulator